MQDHAAGAAHKSPANPVTADKDDALLQMEHRENGVVVLTMQSRKGPVTLSEEMLSELQAVFDRLTDDDAAHVIVLGSTGPAFCAGHDLKEMTAHRADPDGGRAYYAQLMKQCATMMQTIVRCPKPVIAMVHGPAAAAGCQLVATCDLAVASDDATFGTTGINNGLFCSTPMVALSRKVHRKHALEMLFTGALVTAERAYEMGLVNHVVLRSELETETLRLAGAIAAQSPAAIAFGKTAFYQQIESPLAEAYELTADVMVENMMHCDAIEGIGAFIEKRKPTWRGNKG